MDNFALIIQLVVADMLRLRRESGAMYTYSLLALFASEVFIYCL